MFKLIGVIKTGSTGNVRTALINFFKLRDVGGLRFLESVGCWVFFADPKSVEEVGKLPENSWGIQIESWDPVEVDRCRVDLVVLASDTCRNKEEPKRVRKASQVILEAFGNKYPGGIEEAVSLTSSLNRRSFCYSLDYWNDLDRLNQL